MLQLAQPSNQHRSNIVQRINITVICEVFKNLALLQHILNLSLTCKTNLTKQDIYTELFGIRALLPEISGSGLFRLNTCINDGKDLLDIVNECIKSDSKDYIGFDILCRLEKAVNKFELSFKNEMSVQLTYIATDKGYIDIGRLHENPYLLMPSELQKQADYLLPELEKCASCFIASLPEACIFHLMRILESLVKRYYEKLGIELKQEPFGVGGYISAIENYYNSKSYSDKGRLISMLRSINTNIRNPIIHPETKDITIEDAQQIIGSTREVVSLLLKELKEE